MKVKRNNQQGQSTIEFIFSFGFAFFLIIYTLKVALNYTTGYLVHYATYMASRTYLTFENSGAATDPALIIKEVFDDTKVGLYNKQIIVDTNTLKPQLEPAGAGVLNGVSFDWSTTFSTVGLFGGRAVLNMKSESFLGREPDRKECSKQTCTAARRSPGACGKAFTVVDNGC